MDKIFIKDVPVFCQLKQKISGIHNMKTEDFLGNHERELRFPSQNFQVSYDFSGFVLYENQFYLSGNWCVDFQLKCTYCQDVFSQRFERRYEKLRLIPENDNLLDYPDEDAQECRFDFFDLRPWIFSEIMMELPLSPKHSSCAMSFDMTDL